MKKTLILLILMASSAQTREREEMQFLRWKWKTSQVLELNEYHDVVVLMAGTMVQREDKNRILLKTKACDMGACKVEGWFDTYSRYGKNSGPFQKDKEYKVEFSIARNGRYSVPELALQPNLRSFPSFPDRELMRGEKWTLVGEEFFNFQKKQFLVPVDAEYTLLGESDWKYEGNGGRSEKIQFQYKINYRNEEDSIPGVPDQISGNARGNIFFDAKKGIPEYKEVRIDYEFILPDKSVQKARFQIYGVYQLRDSLSQKGRDSIEEQVLRDLIVPGDPVWGDTREAIQEKSKMQILQTEEGMTFALDAMLFDTKDANLKPEALVTLGKIARILKRYPDREIRISGHTDNVGTSESNLKLSEQRALQVLQNLIENHNIPEERISFQGLGSSKPIATNDTEKGRAKNRRVEVTLLLD